MKKQNRKKDKKGITGVGKRILALFMAALMVVGIPDYTGFGMNQVQAQSVQETQVTEETQDITGQESRKETEPETELSEEDRQETTAETEAETEQESEAETETEVESEQETETITIPETETESEIETETESEPETESEATTQVETESVSEVETATTTEPETTDVTEPEMETETEAISETEPETELTKEGEEESVRSINGNVIGRFFAFANKADHMEYEVLTNKYVKLVEGSYHTYDVDHRATGLYFTVTATGKYEPEVVLSSLRTGEERTLQATEVTKTKGKTVYNYAIEDSMIPFRDEVVSITETIDPEEVKLSFNEDEVSIVSASIGVQKIEAREDDNSEGCTYEVAYDSVITFKVEPKENCKLKGAVTTGASTKKEKVKANGFTFSIKVTQDTETVITSEALYKAEVYEKENLLKDTKGVYTLNYGNSYSMCVLHGVEEKADISKVEVLQGKKEAASTATISEDRKKALFTIDPAEAGKKLTVKLTTGEGENIQTSTVTLKVLPIVNKVTVAGVKKGILLQTADSVKEYKLTINPKTASHTLAAEVTAAGENPTEEDVKKAQEAVKAEVTGNKLVITTLSKEVQANAAVVKLYNTATGTEEEKAYVTGGSFNVSITTPTMVNIKPTVALKKSDDDSLTLTLGAKKAETPNQGKIYYKVEIIPQESKEGTIPETITEATAEPFYVEKTAATQDVTLVVNNCGAGNGQEWKYDVTATLLQTKDDTELTKYSEESITVFRTTEGKEGKKKGLATKNPCYETKLKLKKGTTTIYSNQQDVVVATVQFGKDTTFTDLTVSSEPSWKGPLDVKVVDNQIVVSGKGAMLKFWQNYDSHTAIGKHTITVTAETPENKAEVTASIDVKVIPAIEQIIVTSPTRMYKGEKKASSISASVSYNKNFEKAPQKEKVSWSIVDTEGNAFQKGDALYGMLTVKNGKVTLNKNYMVSAKEEDNQFKIKVTAADFKGNTTCGYSNTITVTSEELEMGDVVLATLSSDGYDVVARGGDVIGYNETTGLTAFVVVKKGVPEKDKYELDEIIDWDEVKVTHNSKAIKLNNHGFIQDVYKPFKNVKFTVTASDGSKQKATFGKLTMTYAQLKDLGVEVERYSYFADERETFGWGIAKQAEMDTRDFEFCNATQDTIMRVTVKWNMAADIWYPIHRDSIPMYNYTIDFKGCKVTSQSDSSYNIIMSGKEASIILKFTNKDGEKVIKEYNFKNKALSQQRALNLEQTGKLYAGYCDGPQTLTFKLPDSYDWEGKYAMVTPEIVGDKAGWERYEILEPQMKSFMGKYIPVSDDGEIELVFDKGGYSIIPKATYVFYINFGTLDKEGNFNPDVNPTKITWDVKYED